MSDSTPDLVHIYGGWRHFVPAAISSAVVIVLAVLTWRRHKFFPRAPWLPSELLFMAILAAAPLFLYGFVLSVFATRAIDYLRENPNLAGLVTEVEKRTGLRLPEDARIEAAVAIGNRRPFRWFAIRGDMDDVPDQLLDMAFQGRETDENRIRSPRPEPVETWIQGTDFQPARQFSKSNENEHHEVYIDPSRGLLLVLISGR